ncbi:NAD(P)/FAD-dependent oxidoreductase [Flavobacterium agricola]|uniref:NADH:ubiquinone reductase (non-electrogenic) n=1 Tax=Flavobacterium agricola TaxID=2870839 RepID=A0ABY6M3S0_9FLAO|nr:NAD(P)/FAD-dependent oxidoreductase [Flavobacterium agricola]UYW01673.1 NAD(P)/FAD-dependent oxidoreductase [Flavobacterium agricola]
MMNIPDSSNPRVVIVGGGFAGISLAKKLKDRKFQVVLLDKHNYHNFQPLMYQVATGGLEAGSIAYPLRKIVQDHQETFFRMANVESVDTTNKKVITDIGTIYYDYLVLATGSTNNFFGNKEIEENSMVMKSIPEALDILSLILENFELALQTNDIEERKALMNFVIVGAGPTGVELAGALAEMKKAVFPKDYPDLDISMMEIHLVQGTDRVLDAMSVKSSEAAAKFLRQLGVKIHIDVRVTGYDGLTVTTASDLTLTSKAVIWSAGVKGCVVDGVAEAVDRASRIRTNEFNQVEGFTDVFAIGDVAAIYGDKYKFGHPMMAQPAIQQGALLAENLERLERKQPLKQFVYNDKGSMATIGRNKAVVDMPKFHFNGIFAWFVWMFVHLISLIGFKNKALVFCSWIYNYFAFDRESRVIIKEYKKKEN